VIVVTLPIDGLSPSSLDLWRHCPRKFYEEKIAGRPQGMAGEPALLGTFVHLTLEYLMQRPAAERTVDAAKVDARTAWDEFSVTPDWLEWCEFAEFDPDGPEGRDFRWRAWQSVCGLFRIEDPAQIDVVATEQFVSAKLGDAPVRGIVDRLERDNDGNLVVSDYKTGRVPDARFRESKDRQLTMYAAMLAEQGETPVLGRLLFTSHHTQLLVQFDEVRIADAIDTVSTAWNQITDAFEQDRWPERPGALCGWCPFVEECDAGLAEVVERRATGKLKRSAPAWDLAAPVELL
jgi:putative RecB family exonuclease